MVTFFVIFFTGGQGPPGAPREAPGLTVGLLEGELWLGYTGAKDQASRDLRHSHRQSRCSGPHYSPSRAGPAWALSELSKLASGSGSKFSPPGSLEK